MGYTVQHCCVGHFCIHSVYVYGLKYQTRTHLLLNSKPFKNKHGWIANCLMPTDCLEFYLTLVK